MREMFTKLLAKSGVDKSVAETIRVHTDKLLDRHSKLQEIYPHALSKEDWALLAEAAEYHDVGKANTKFQNKLRKIENEQLDLLEGIEEVPHAYLSCAYMPLGELLNKYGKEQVHILMLAVYYHHERNEERLEDCKQVIEQDLINYVSALANEGFNVNQIPRHNFGKFTDKEFLRVRENLYHFVRIKGLLNKLDYAASGHLDVEIAPEDVFGIVDKYFKSLGYRKNDLQEYLLQYQNDNHVVIASTGIGKTEGALYWLGQDKGIFTLPLKVSINAIYDRIHKDFGYKQVGLLHSDMRSEYAKRAGDQDLDLFAINHTKQLAQPLTITTLDQVIDFVGLYPGFELKLAIFSYSKFIIDEIQMYSPRLVAFILMGLKYITDMGGKFLIMTATLPPLFIEAMHKLKIPFKQPDNPFLKLNEHGKVMNRHVIQIIERDLTVEEVVPHSLNQKVLIIVNTVKKAQELYDEFIDADCEVNLLHSRFINNDRSEKEKSITKLGKRDCDETGIWITTQLVEASVDIDFDILFTELSEATGLFQRMGRVYRGRDYKNTTPNVYVFTGYELPSGVSESDKRSVVDYTIYQKSREVLLQYNNQLLKEKTKMDIINQIYSRETLGDNCSYLREFDVTLAQLENVLPYEEKEKPTLRDIENQTIIPFAIYQEKEEELQKIQKKLKEKPSLQQRITLLDQLQNYTISIPKWAYKMAEKEFKYDAIAIDKYTNYPIIAFRYTKEKGLIFEIEEGANFL